MPMTGSSDGPLLFQGLVSRRCRLLRDCEWRVSLFCPSLTEPKGSFVGPLVVVVSLGEGGCSFSAHYTRFLSYCLDVFLVDSAFAFASAFESPQLSDEGALVSWRFGASGLGGGWGAVAGV